MPKTLKALGTLKGADISKPLSCVYDRTRRKKVGYPKPCSDGRCGGDGQVGSGKSTLLGAILGDLNLRAGAINVTASMTAYAAQKVERWR